MTSKITYVGDFKIISEHEKSGAEIVTCAPLREGGTSEYFSPSDIFGISYGQSMLMAVAVLGKPRGIDITGATCELKKSTYPEPKRIGTIFCIVRFPKNYTPEEKKFIEDTALNCPVALSIHPNVQTTVLFEYGH
ncbi:OsmC family protein [Chryseobacterium suipulveris]|uniref:OsmC family protein n=1 Tax=Chryseobacterium suipulveris TaxID=2929800 RepID=A0ABY4BQ52_9FLAO|nr:OsmC family protein [Chryseobacterium suipulveris]UOE41328.1 OsmC family protein [Chryseobacterium suipulveris]